MIGLGSRVRYTNGHRSDWLGLDATVTCVWESGKVDVEFDKPWGGNHTAGRHIPLSSLKELTMIDPKRPVQTTESEPRLCRTIGVLERVEGTITLLLAVPDTGEVEIDLEGHVVSPGGLYRTGSVYFRNVPKVESGFYPLDKRGYPNGARGLVSLSFAKSEHSAAPFFLEVVTVDGVPTEAKIHAR